MPLPKLATCLATTVMIGLGLFVSSPPLDAIDSTVIVLGEEDMPSAARRNNFTIAVRKRAPAAARRGSSFTREQSRDLLAFIHIPKTGGSTVEKIGREHGLYWGLHDWSWRVDAQRGRGLCDHHHRIPTGRKPGVKTFCIMRDPIERAMSEVRWQISAYKELWFNDTEAKMEAHDGDAHPSGEEGSGCLGARFLNERLQTCAKWGSHGSCHWIPQAAYLRECDHVLRFEHLRPDFNRLMRHYHLDEVQMPEGFALNNSTSKITRQKKRRVCNDSLWRTQSALSLATLTHLRSFYEADVHIHGMLNEDTIFDEAVFNDSGRSFHDAFPPSSGETRLRAAIRQAAVPQDSNYYCLGIHTHTDYTMSNVRCSCRLS